jgi:predicted Fe-Mo cluster-binding NifX family protein
MKIVITSTGADLDRPSSGKFGRCPMFLFVDTESMEFEAAANPAADASGGAGIQAAQFVVESGVDAVITGKVGPNAMEVLEAAGMPVYLFGGGSVRQAVEQLETGALELATSSEDRRRASSTEPSRGSRERGMGKKRSRIAFSSEDNRGLDSIVSHHFGRCPYYVLADVEHSEVRDVATVENPFFGNHQPGQVPRFIGEQGADVIVTGGMGRRALAIFESERIETVTGAQGTVAEVLKDYLGGRLTGAEPCRDSVQHKHAHQHHHQHGPHGHGCGSSAVGEPGGGDDFEDR